MAEGQAPGALAAMRTLGLSGLSVTMPHKTAVADHLDAQPWGELSDTARRLRAVNCVVTDGDRLVGHNTDGAGFVASLGADAGFSPDGARCVVLGAGGAARALILALAQAGAAEVVVVNRSPDRATEAAALAGPVGRVGAFGATDVLAGADLVVNATSGGDGRAFGPGRPRRPGATMLVADIVMQPLDTPLLQAAAARGAATLTGLGMLARQAAVAFELWTGQEAPVEVMVRAARGALDSRKGPLFRCADCRWRGVHPLSEVIVALQGTLETFALPDVLRLLASTHKTGRLRLTGSSGSGSLWLDGGAIVGSEAARAPLADGPTDVLFELLRFKEGDFVFDDDATTAEASGTPTDVEDALAAAEAMLEEWKAIEAVVPSLAGWVSLRAELPGDEVTVDAAHWRQLVSVGGGITVAGLGDQLGLGELPISRAVKDLIELGLVELGDAPAGAIDAAPAPAYASAAVDDVALDTFADAAPAITFDSPADGDTPLLTVVSDADAEGDHFDPNALVIEEPDLSTAVADTTDEEDMADAAEIARQLANLSPKAAKAVAAAAKATTSEEREAALAEVDETEDPINRGLLLKFLGSVNG